MTTQTDLERFKRLLDIAADRIDSNHAVAPAVLRALTTDFENIFSRDKYLDAIDLYCHEEGCPICGDWMMQEQPGESYYCLACKGKRDPEYRPVINPALKEFISSQFRKEEQQSTRKDSLKRFDGIIHEES